jgi:PAS domain S-box-containing protein
VADIAASLQPLQDGFSQTLGEGSRWLNTVLRALAVLVVGGLSALAVLIYRWTTRRIAESERKFRDTFEQAAIGMAQVTANGELVAVNQAFCCILDLPRQDLIGSLLVRLLHPDQDASGLQQFLAGTDRRHIEEYRLLGGRGRPLWCRFSVSSIEDAWNGEDHLVLSVEDVTEARRLSSELSYQARHDLLTGMPNRREFEERLTEALDVRRSIATAGAWCRLWRRTGDVRPGRQGQPEGSKLDPHADFIIGLVEEIKDIALAEIAERLAQERGVQACPATIWYFFDKRRITFKKRRRMPASSSVQM